MNRSRTMFKRKVLLESKCSDFCFSISAFLRPQPRKARQPAPVVWWPLPRALEVSRLQPHHRPIRGQGQWHWGGGHGACVPSECPDGDGGGRDGGAWLQSDRQLQSERPGHTGGQRPGGHGAVQAQGAGQGYQDHGQHWWDLMRRMNVIFWFYCYADGFVWLDKKSASELQFSVLVTRPGFYHLNNFQFRAKQTVRSVTKHSSSTVLILQDICDKECFDQTAEKFLQVDISFSVKQKWDCDEMYRDRIVVIY